MLVSARLVAAPVPQCDRCVATCSVRVHQQKIFRPQKRTTTSLIVDATGLYFCRQLSTVFIDEDATNLAAPGAHRRA